MTTVPSGGRATGRSARWHYGRPGSRHLDLDEGARAGGEIVVSDQSRRQTARKYASAGSLTSAENASNVTAPP